MNFINDMLTAFARPLPKVYPFYIASRVKRSLNSARIVDTENIIESVGEIETIGDCRYALTVKDCSGTSYRITVEVVNDKQLKADPDWNDLVEEDSACT